MGIVWELAPEDKAVVTNVIPFPTAEVQGLSPEMQEVITPVKSAVATFPVTLQLSAEQLAAIGTALAANGNAAPIAAAA